MGDNGKVPAKKPGRGGKRPGAGPPGNANGMTHGARALEEILKQTLPPDNPIGRILAVRRDLYLSDLGGPDACSNLEQGLIERLAKLDLFEALLDARLIDPVTGKARQLSWSRLHSLGQLRVRLGDSYARMASALGLRRREKPVPSLHEWLQAPQDQEGDE